MSTSHQQCLSCEFEGTVECIDCERQESYLVSSDLVLFVAAIFDVLEDLIERSWKIRLIHHHNKNS